MAEAQTQTPLLNPPEPVAATSPVENMAQPTVPPVENQQQTIPSHPVPEKVSASNPQVLFSWTAPLRAYKKRGKNVMRFYIALALILSLLVLFFGDKILLIPIGAVLFLFYVLTITPPPDVENKIAKFGVETAGTTIRWDALSHFFFTKRFGFNILTLVSKPPYYFHSYLIVSDEIKEKVIHMLSEHLIYMEQPTRSFTDRMVDWLAMLIPDDEEPKEKVTQEQTSSFAQTHAQTSP